MISPMQLAATSRAKYNDEISYNTNKSLTSAAGLIPESFPLDLDASLSNGIDGLPSHIEFQGRSPPDFESSHRGRTVSSSSNNNNNNNRGVDAELPNLKPNERSGTCQRYTGSVCSKYTGNHLIFISQVSCCHLFKEFSLLL